MNLALPRQVSAVDASAMTLTVGTLTLQITSDTKITKDGKSATLADGVVGEQVSGAYKKTDDGKLNRHQHPLRRQTEKNQCGNFGRRWQLMVRSFLNLQGGRQRPPFLCPLPPTGETFGLLRLRL
jgi:hypothetical protein